MTKKDLGTIMQIGCTLGLCAIALKRNYDCYKAEMRNAYLEGHLEWEKLNSTFKDANIRLLKEELEELKTED